MPATARFSVPVCVLLFACDPANTDNDNDGYTADVDCNDADDTINPGVSQDLCDGVDADCDGLFDEDGLPTVIFADSDGDGFGNPFAPGFACTIPSGYVTNDDDCDDTDVNVNPDAKDICNLKNDDCDFFVDEDEPPIKVWHDRDEDGFGD
ncbi:MAG: MopE-related protein, partial [Myxococcota bacterium]